MLLLLLLLDRKKHRRNLQTSVFSRVLTNVVEYEAAQREAASLLWFTHSSMWIYASDYENKLLGGGRLISFIYREVDMPLWCIFLQYKRIHLLHVQKHKTETVLWIISVFMKRSKLRGERLIFYLFTLSIYDVFTQYKRIHPQNIITMLTTLLCVGKNKCEVSFIQFYKRQSSNLPLLLLLCTSLMSLKVWWYCCL